MSIISGQDTALQIGRMSTWPVGGVMGLKKATHRVPYISETFKGVPNYKASEALVGAKATPSMAIMSQKANGGFRSYITPDLASLLFYLALGKELALRSPGAAGTRYVSTNPPYETIDLQAASGSEKVHSFTPVPSGLLNNMPGLFVEVDRILEKALYAVFKMNTWSLEAGQEDYAYFECDGPAHSENLQDPIVHSQKVAVSAGIGTLVTGAIPTTLVTLINLVPSKVVHIYTADGSKEFWATVGTVTTNTTGTMTAIAGYAIDNTIVAGDNAWCDIYDWTMTYTGTTALLLALSTQEYFRFAHARIYVEGAQSDYIVTSAGLGQGRATDTILNCPTRTGADTAANMIIVQANNNRGEPCLYKYQGTAITRSALPVGTITFSDSPAGSDIIKSIHTSAGVLNTADWKLYDELFEEISRVKVSGNNNLKDGKFGANGSLYQTEIQPGIRDFTLEADMDFTKKGSDLRKRKMLSGATCRIRFWLSTSINPPDSTTAVNTSVDSQGKPYIICVTLPSCYFIDGIPNIGGPDQPTMSAKFQAREIPGVTEAIIVEVYDDVNSLLAAEAARIDGN